jgi:Peptidase family M1 domain
VTVVMRNALGKIARRVACRILLAAAAGCVFPAACLAQSPASAAHPAEDLFLRLGSVGLDPARVYHVRDAHIDRPGFYLTFEDGTIAFTEDVLGRVTGALFEGEGEVLVLPPDRAERSSLALFTGAAVLEERITFAYVRFNDGTYSDFNAHVGAAGDPARFVSRWSARATELARADAVRLLETYAALLPSSEPPPPASKDVAQDRILHARFLGAKLGGFDLYYDSLSDEQVQVLQLSETEGASYYDIWMSFSPKPRGGDRSIPKDDGPDPFEISNYKIQARIAPPNRLEAEATCDLHVVREGQRALLFELSRYLLVTRVEASGESLEFIHNPSVTGSQLARQGNDMVAVVFPRTLRPGERITLKFTYGGDVLSEEANGLLAVGARGTWYPNRGLRMASFDLDFAYPAGWTLLATGTRTGPEEIPSPNAVPTQELHSHWISSRPVPVAGFNLGRYVKATAKAGNVVVEAYATGEMGLAAPKVAPGLASAPGDHLPDSSPPMPQFFGPPSPARNVQAVADRAAEAVTFFSERFGAYPYGSLALTQSPGPTSQGWPGLVFLSGYAFLSPEQLASRNLRPADSILARQTPAHETAHQWWGDLVPWKSYRDQWISEGLASYCALLELEARDPEASRLVLDNYRDDLLQNKNDRRLLEAGAVTLGQRLNSSRFPYGYELIAYGRGAWLFHMLRQMLRDDAILASKGAANGNPDELFMSILRSVQDRYAGKSLSTRQLLEEFAARWPKSLWFEGKPSLDWFWDGWIQGTSVPAFELKGVKIQRLKDTVSATGTIVQRDGPDDLVTPVPIYAEVPGKASVLLGRVFADGRETTFHLRIPAGAKKILLDPQQTLLRQH